MMISKPESLEARNKVYTDRAKAAIKNPTGREEMRNIYFGIVMGLSAIIPTCVHIFCAIFSLRFFWNKITDRIFWHISPKIFEPFLDNYILSSVKKYYDLIYVKSGDLIGKNLILKLKKKTKKIVFFCNENPFTTRDKQRWKLFFLKSSCFLLIIYKKI